MKPPWYQAGSIYGLDGIPERSNPARRVFFRKRDVFRFTFPLFFGYL